MSGSRGYSTTDWYKEPQGVFRLGEELNKDAVFHWFFSTYTASALQMKLLQGLKT